MKISIIGTGYVGLVTGLCFAEMGNDVICVDNKAEIIKELESGKVHIYEPGLEELLKTNIAEGRINFTTDIVHAVRESLLVFIAVGTPQTEEGCCDISAIMSVAKVIKNSLNGYKIIVNKSTAPIGTSEEIKKEIRSKKGNKFDIVSNPEFLKQGSAIEDCLKPDRVVIGAESSKAIAVLKELYAPFLRNGNPFIVMDLRSAEMTKYAANTLLASRISFINEMANICELVGADIEQVRLGITVDKRIGPHFLYPGLGYGGSCFNKDVKALMKVAHKHKYEPKILEAVDYTNKKQRELFFQKIEKYFKGNISGKKFAVWGLSFKPHTNDMREAPSITIINKLLESGATITAFDPKAMKEAKKYFKDKIEYVHNNYDALKAADALILMTEWNEFRRPDFNKIKSLLKSPVVFDGRNQYNAITMKKSGFSYICIGK